MDRGNLVGVLLAIGFFVLIIATIFTHSIATNLRALLTYFLLNLILILGLPRLFPKNSFVQSVRTGFELFGRALNKIVITGALIIVYVVGVGLVWLVSRVARKQFLSTKATKTTWHQHTTQQESFEEMF
jgi:hypothetical protein